MTDILQPSASDLSPADHEQELLATYGISPDQAERWLAHLGYTPEYWEEVLTEKNGSHELRGLVRIAQGNERRLLESVYNEERERDSSAGGSLNLAVDAALLRAQTQRLYEWLEKGIDPTDALMG